MLLNLELFDFLLSAAIDVFFCSASELLGPEASAGRLSIIPLRRLHLRFHLHLIHKVLVGFGNIIVSFPRLFSSCT